MLKAEKLILWQLHDDENRILMELCQRFVSRHFTR